MDAFLQKRRLQPSLWPVGHWQHGWHLIEAFSSCHSVATGQQSARIWAVTQDTKLSWKAGEEGAQGGRESGTWQTGCLSFCSKWEILTCLTRLGLSSRQRKAAPVGLLLTAVGQLVPQAPGQEACSELCTFLTRLRVTGEQVAVASLGWVGTINFPNTARNQARCRWWFWALWQPRGECARACTHLHVLTHPRKAVQRGEERGRGRQIKERKKEVLRRQQGS